MRIYGRWHDIARAGRAKCIFSLSVMVALVPAINDPGRCAMSGEETTRVYIGGLSERTTKEDLRERCSRYGEVVDVDFRSLNYASGEWMRSFAFVDLKGNSCLEKCRSQLSGIWKGGKLVVSAASEDPAERRLREASALKHHLEVKPSKEKILPVPRYCADKGALPGTVLEDHKKWVVTKFQRVVPIMKIRTKDRKSSILYDPSKYCHQLKKLDRPDSKSTDHELMGKVENLTWQLPDEPTRRDLLRQQALSHPVKRRIPTDGTPLANFAFHPPRLAPAPPPSVTLIAANLKMIARAGTVPIAIAPRVNPKPVAVKITKQCHQTSGSSLKADNPPTKLPLSENSKITEDKALADSTLSSTHISMESENADDVTRSSENKIEEKVSDSVIKITPVQPQIVCITSSASSRVVADRNGEGVDSKPQRSTKISGTGMSTSEAQIARSRIVGDLASLERPGRMESDEGESDGSSAEESENEFGEDRYLTPASATLRREKDNEIDRVKAFVVLSQPTELMESARRTWLEPTTEHDAEPDTTPETEAATSHSFFQRAPTDEDELIIVPPSTEYTAPLPAPQTKIAEKSRFDSSDSEGEKSKEEPSYKLVTSSLRRRLRKRGVDAKYPKVKKFSSETIKSTWSGRRGSRSGSSSRGQQSHRGFRGSNPTAR